MEFQNTTVFDWAEVKETFLRSMDGTSPLLTEQAAHASSVESWKSGYSSFSGSSGDEMVEYVRDGFRSEDFAHATDTFEGADRRRIRFDEEGELDLPLAWSGHDYPYLAWENRPVKPGMKITVEMAFLASTDSKTITEYGAWVAGVIAKLEQDGYDLAVSIVCPSQQGVYAGARTQQMECIVKREGEASDFTEWSAWFAPGAFRILGFTLRAMHCQKLGRKLSAGYGRSLNGQWGIEWNEAERHLTIKRPPHATDFPEEMMTDRLIEEGIFS
jgi:hypothetical protein